MCAAPGTLHACAHRGRHCVCVEMGTLCVHAQRQAHCIHTCAQTDAQCVCREAYCVCAKKRLQRKAHSTCMCACRDRHSVCARARRQAHCAGVCAETGTHCSDRHTVRKERHTVSVCVQRGTQCVHVFRDRHTGQLLCKPQPGGCREAGAHGPPATRDAGPTARASLRETWAWGAAAASSWPLALCWIMTTHGHGLKADLCAARPLPAP